MSESNYLHEENQRKFNAIEDRLKKLEEDMETVKELLAEQRGAWKVIKTLLSLGAVLLSGELGILLYQAMKP